MQPGKGPSTCPGCQEGPCPGQALHQARQARSRMSGPCCHEGLWSSAPILQLVPMEPCRSVLQDSSSQSNSYDSVMDHLAGPAARCMPALGMLQAATECRIDSSCCKLRHDSRYSDKSIADPELLHLYSKANRTPGADSCCA